MSTRSHVTLFLCGDVMTGRGIDQVLHHSCDPRLHERFVTSALDYVALAERTSGPMPRGVDDAYVWGEALDVLASRRPDARIVNLETSITTSDDADPKGINYRMHPENVGVLTAAAIDCCVLANNHVIDWGRAGLDDTLDTLCRAGVRVAGAGRDLCEARSPAVLDVRDAEGDVATRVLVYAFGATDSGIPTRWAAGAERSGVHLLRDYSDASVEEIASVVHATKQSGDMAIASIHWGGNWGYHVPHAHRRFAHALIDRAGIDVVHGHSSHHSKAIEVYRGHVILYGCGDFLTDYEGIPGHDEFRDDLTLAYFPVIDIRSGQLVRLEMVPLQIRSFSLRRAPALDRAWSRDTLDRQCRRFGARVTPVDDALVFEAL
ncbi:MAG TPA: CapA family protein [Gemmatimonadaceae bacterium]|nr:CapA family protein [Gemmatimonadaceae bacterium]